MMLSLAILGLCLVGEVAFIVFAFRAGRKP